MAFVFSIIIAVLIAIAAVKVGFYQIWAVLINLLVSVYLSINLHPQIAAIVGVGDGLTAQVLTIFFSALALFAILYGLCYVFMLGEFNITFPKALDTVGAAAVGFFAGLFLAGFLGLLICSSPLANTAILKTLGCDVSSIQQSALGSYVNWWCGRLDAVLVPGSEQATAQALSELTQQAKDQAAKARPPAPASPQPPAGAEDPNADRPAPKPTEIAP